METKARYFVIGLLALAVIVGGFGFVYWLNTSGGLAKRTVYRIDFASPASGLIPGAAVLFNGIRVGEVTSLQLDPRDPHAVSATVAVDARTPVRADTQVGLDFRGLTGVPTISLTGGAADAPAIEPQPGELPALSAGAAASQDTMGAARQALQHFDQILTDNAAPLKATIANLSTFSEALARNSDRLDKIAQGLAKMVGGEGEKAIPGSLGLTAPTSFPEIAKLPEGQLVIAAPTAAVLFDTQRILVTTEGSTSPAFDNAKWSDNLPVLIQGTIVQAFENANYLRVSRPADGLTANDQLLVDIRNFAISAGPEPVAKVEFAAKILAEGGAIVGGRVFQATAPVKAMEPAAAAAALDEAFGKAATELVVWTLGTM
jgi:phospholipid/cholesterol/gamma-HCH transport system substrate-binding protein